MADNKLKKFFRDNADEITFAGICTVSIVGGIIGYKLSLKSYEKMFSSIIGKALEAGQLKIILTTEEFEALAKSSITV